MKLWYKNSKPHELTTVPFLHPDVIKRLDGLIQSDWEILEHGSGGSTLWLADRCKRVVSVENNMEWFRAVGAFAKTSHRNVELIYSNEIQPGKYDLIFIDGEPLEVRAVWLAEAVKHIKPGGWIVLDNANQPCYALGRQYLKEISRDYFSMDFNEVNTLYLVTDFFKMW